MGCGGAMPQHQHTMAGRCQICALLEPRTKNDDVGRPIRDPMRHSVAITDRCAFLAVAIAVGCGRRGGHATN